MASKIDDLLDRSDDPEKALQTYMRQISVDMGQLNAEAASVSMEERRAKRALEECGDEIRKLQRYAEKSVENGDESGARRFLERKLEQAGKEAQLRAAYEAAAANAAKLRQLQEKLTSDMERLEARGKELQGKLAAARTQQRLNAMGSPEGGREAGLDALEEKIDREYYEALAIAELRNEQESDLDAEIAKLETNTGGTVEDELAAIRAKQQRKP